MDMWLKWGTEMAGGSLGSSEKNIYWLKKKNYWKIYEVQNCHNDFTTSLEENPTEVKRHNF